MIEKNSRFRPLLSASLAVLFLAALPAPVHAGDGRVRSSGGVQFLDFCVSIRFTATQAQLDNIERAFVDGNVVFADATDDQYRFGKIGLINNSGGSRQAEVWILPGTGRAYATCGLYGTPGEHITMYYADNFVGSPSNDGDAYTVAHEYMHHVWGVKDEYSGPGGAGDCEATPGSATANFCLMDNYFTRGGNAGTGTTYTLNDLCVSSNHDPDGDTHQDSKWSQSCWERLAAHPTRPVTAPAGLPTSGAPTVSDPTFRFPVTERRFVTCIDRSGSMSIRDGGTGTPTRLDFAKAASEIFINLTKVGDSLGITSFSSSARTDFALKEILGQTQRDEAIAKVNSLVASGSTAIGSGLIQSRGLITGQAELSCAQTIILFTDGFGNAGPGELTVIPSLIDNDISVITIAVGGTTNVANLQAIASQTGGKFFQVTQAADLPPLLAALVAESSGGGVLANQPGVVADGESVSLSVLVDDITAEATFVLSWKSPADNLDLSLSSPSGTTIDAATAGVDPDVDFLSSTTTEILQVRGSALESGTWTVNVAGNSVNGGGEFDLTSLSDTDALSFTVTTDKPVYNFPDVVKIFATPRFNGNNVLGATVNGTVTRADGTQVGVMLVDDGDPNNGDDLADDGVYGALFSAFADSGAYCIDLTVDSTGGVTYGGEDLFAHTEPFSEPVPSFKRSSSTTTVVNGVPDNTPPQVICPSPPTAAECTSPDGAPVTLVAEVCDQDGDNLTVTMTVNGDVVDVVNVPADGPPTLAMVELTHTFPLGVNSVTLTVGDGIATHSCTLSVEVVDTTPPTVEMQVDQVELWPPNHKMVPVTIHLMAEDLCELPDFDFPLVVKVTSDEPDNAQGAGDGNTIGDVEGLDAFVAPIDVSTNFSRDWSTGMYSATVQLRAERDRSKNGRTYVIEATVTDSNGNSTVTTLEVIVPHSQQGGTK